MNQNLNIRSMSNEELAALGLIVNDELERRSKSQETTLEDFDAVIYVDGSYNNDTEQYAYGMMIEDSKGVHYFSKAYPKDNMSSMRNVAGEIAGSRTAIQYCLDNGFKNVQLNYDYIGIEKWCSGEWKAKNQSTKAYQDFYHDASEHVNIHFNHTPGHSGIEGNEVCDSLAKQALGIPDTKKKREMFSEALASAKPYVSNSERLVNKLVSEWDDVEKEHSEIECSSLYVK